MKALLISILAGRYIMKSGKSLKSLLNRNRNSVILKATYSIIILVVSVVIINAIISGYACISKNEDENSYGTKETSLKSYHESRLICSEYDTAVEHYNNSVDKMNILLGKLSTDGIINNGVALEKKQGMTKAMKLLPLRSSIFKKIDQNTDYINENTLILNEQYKDLCEIAYKAYAERYNLFAEEYNELMNKTSVDYINNMPLYIELKPTENCYLPDEESIFRYIEEISIQTDELMSLYKIADQITSPDEEWVKDRLGAIKAITGYMAVNNKNGPNNMLGKKEGYSACVYFTVKSIDDALSNRKSIISRGTDGGGAVEVYPDIKSAENRCEYLSQFDGTLIDSGSHILVGTMVIRTSYNLSDEEQIKLIDELVTVFTAL